MKIILLTLCALVLLAAVVQAQEAPVAIGARSYLKADGKVQRMMGMGNSPVNYQDTDSTWDYIVDDFVQIGDRQIWKSVRGNHKLWADSTGAAIYAKGNHYLGTETTQLIKFNTADSGFVTLKNSVPDSITVNGPTITFHNIFPGVDKQLVNRPKIFRRYTETFIFHQEARDSLATWGPWSGRLLGTATKLTVDSLNLTLHDIAGAFDINTTGRMVDRWVRLKDGDNILFRMASTNLRTEDSVVTSMPVKKWIVRYGGSPWLIELFDPVAANQLPAGDITHDVVLGDDDAGNWSYAALNNQWQGGTAVASASGTMDSMAVYLEEAGDYGTPCNHRTAVYTFASGTAASQAQVDTSAEISLDPDDASFAWYIFSLQNNGAITSGETYVLWAWGDGAGTDAERIQYAVSAGDTNTENSSETYVGNTWDNPPDACTEYSNYQVAILGWFTEAGEPSASTLKGRRRVISGGSQ